MSKVVLKNKNSLPVNWVDVKLGDICELIGGGTPSRKNSEYFEGNILWLTPTEIPKNKIIKIKTSKEKITELGLKKSSAKIIPKDSVLLTSRASIGFVAIAGTDVTTNQGFSSFVCTKIINNYFLAYWLFGHVGLLKSKATGTTFKEISKSTLRELKLSLPSLNEQKRIVKKIEIYFSLINDLINAFLKINEKKNQLKSSILHYEFKNKDHKFETKTIDDVFKIIDYRGRTPSYSESGIPHLRSNNVKNGEINQNKIKFVTEETYKKFMTRGIPESDDLLFTTEAPLGEISPIPNYKFSLAQRLMVLRPKDHNSKFLMYQIMSPDFHLSLTGKKTGTTVSGVSSKNFKPMKIKTTDIKNEQKIAISIEKKINNLDHMFLQIQHNLDFLFSLKNSILKQAFEGKLISQDPNDDSKEVLLDKITKEKEQLIQKQKVSRRRKNVK